jgi:hypothetical protein
VRKKTPPAAPFYCTTWRILVEKRVIFKVPGRQETIADGRKEKDREEENRQESDGEEEDWQEKDRRQEVDSEEKNRGQKENGSEEVFDEEENRRQEKNGEKSQHRQIRFEVKIPPQVGH